MTNVTVDRKVNKLLTRAYRNGQLGDISKDARQAFTTVSYDVEMSARLLEDTHLVEICAHLCLWRNSRVDPVLGAPTVLDVLAANLFRERFCSLVETPFVFSLVDELVNQGFGALIGVPVVPVAANLSDTHWRWSEGKIVQFRTGMREPSRIVAEISRQQLAEALGKILDTTLFRGRETAKPSGAP